MDWLAKLELTELHTHVGASVSPTMLWEMAHLKKFELTELIQSSPEAMFTAMETVVSGAFRKNNITTLELRYNPIYRNRRGERDLDHTIVFSLQGMERARLKSNTKVVKDYTEFKRVLSMTKLYLTYDDVLLLPNYSEVTPSRTDLEGKIPIIASPMDTVCEKEMALALGKLGGYGIIHRNLPIVKQADQIAWVLKQKVNCGAAVGVGADFEERVKILVKAGAKEICVDSAHGHTKHVGEATAWIKNNFSRVEVISGNVATFEGAEFLFQKGADAVKVGMGPGSICTTRIMSGMGVPQLTAVIDCVRAAKKYKKKIIADGGIKTSGDIVKALAAGADSVMLGSLLAGTDEAPGKLVTIKGKKFKTYRGMGSSAAMKLGSASRYGQEKAAKKFVSEGVEGLVEYQGKLAEVVFQLIGGLRSGMAYLGAKNLKELKQKAKFIQISPAAWAESKPHSLYEQK